MKQCHAVRTSSARVPVFRVSALGQPTLLGQIQPLQDGLYMLVSNNSDDRRFHGMPFFVCDLWPQGFMGRMEAGKHSTLGLPKNIRHWTDAQAWHYISRRSEHAAGDLIVGDESHARYLFAAATASAYVIPQSACAECYPRLAEQSLQGDSTGAPVGGEQPKFTAVIARDDVAQTIEHVIVKFSPPVDSASGRRWGDLLVCEHLALETLASYQIAAAKTTIVKAGDRVFLELADARISADFKSTIAERHLRTLEQVCLTATPPASA